MRGLLRALLNFANHHHQCDHPCPSRTCLSPLRQVTGQSIIFLIKFCTFSRWCWRGAVTWSHSHCTAGIYRQHVCKVVCLTPSSYRNGSKVVGQIGKAVRFVDIKVQILCRYLYLVSQSAVSECNAAAHLISSCARPGLGWTLDPGHPHPQQIK